MMELDPDPIGRRPAALPADDEKSDAAYQEAMREGLSQAVPSMAISLFLGGALMLLGIYAMREPIRSAEEALTAGEDYGYRVYLPLVLFAMFGGLFGLLAGWRMTEASGMVGRLAWLVGAAGVLVLFVMGLVGACLMFSGGVPVMFWAGLVVLGVAALVGVSYHTLWAG